MDRMNISIDIIGYIFAIVGLVLAYIFYIKGKKEKKPIYMCNKISIIGNQYSILGEEVRISYKDRAVEKLSLCDITVRNVGDVAIRRQDIASSDLLRISFDEGVNILSCKVKNVTRAAIGFEISIVENNKAEFSFEFLDKNDGALIEIIHDGTACIAPKLSGTIIGALHGFIEAKEGLLIVTKWDIITPILQIILTILLMVAMNFTMTKMETRFFPISPSVADSQTGKDLIEKASHGDRSAVREIRRLSGLDPLPPLYWVEYVFQGIFTLMVLSLLGVLFSRIRRKKIADLRIDRDK